ncbi:nucleotide-binding alpha-beta plait domain-containing protein [Tanacetum coccineum]
MGSYRTKEDDVARISTSVYITNFPEATSAKELFQACKQYGHVVDSFIPHKKSKFGKKFGFVRFINVFSEERLISNLCTVWMDRFKLHANIARFQRPMVMKEGVGAKKTFVVPTPTDQTKNIGKQSDIKSYKGVLNGIKNKEIEIMTPAPSIVLGEECVMSNKILNALFGRVTEVTNEFEVKGRIAWIEVEGVPFRLWTRNTFARIADKWGKLLDVDDQDDSCFHSKRLCVQMKSSKSIQEEFKIINRGNVYWIRASETPGWVPDFTDDTEDDDINSMDEGDAEYKADDSVINNDEEKVPDTCFEEEEEVKSPVDEKDSENNLEKSEDPFNIMSLLNRHKQGGKKDNISDNSLKYPPGFTPIDRETVEVRPDNIEEANDAQSECCEANKLKGNGNSSTSSGHFKVSEAPRSGGSMIGLLEEVVKVGQVMGFKMDGCISNMEEIIGSQGVEEGYR